MRRYLAAVALALTLTGCGDGIDTGYVTGTTYTPPRDIMHFQCGAYDTKGLCTAQMPIWTHYPEEWRLDLREGDKRGWVTVDKPTYHRYDVGTHYPDPR